jgi:hypothetical protein
MFQIVKVLTDIRSSIWPVEVTITIHLSILPISAVGSLVIPMVSPRSSNLIILELTCESTSFFPYAVPDPILHALIEIPLKLHPVGPNLAPLALLPVELPVPLVDCPIYIREPSVAMSHSIPELSVIYVSLGVD